MLKQKQKSNTEKTINVENTTVNLEVTLLHSVSDEGFEDVILTFEDNVVSTKVGSVFKFVKTQYNTKTSNNGDKDKPIYFKETFDNDFVYSKRYEENNKCGVIVIRNYGSLLSSNDDYYEMVLLIDFLDTTNKLSKIEKKIILKYDKPEQTEEPKKKVRTKRQTLVSVDNPSPLYATMSAKIESLQPKEEEVPILNLKMVANLVNGENEGSTINRYKEVESSDVVETAGLNDVSIVCDIFSDMVHGTNSVEIFGLNFSVTSSAYWCNPTTTIKKEPITLDDDLVLGGVSDHPYKDTTIITFQITDEPIFSRTCLVNISLVDFPDTSISLFIKNLPEN